MSVLGSAAAFIVALVWVFDFYFDSLLERLFDDDVDLTP